MLETNFTNDSSVHHYFTLRLKVMSTILHSSDDIYLMLTLNLDDVDLHFSLF